MQEPKPDARRIRPMDWLVVALFVFAFALPILLLVSDEASRAILEARSRALLLSVALCC